MEAAGQAPSGFLLPRTPWAWLGILIMGSGVVAWLAAGIIMAAHTWPIHGLAFTLLSLILPVTFLIGFNIWLPSSARHRSLSTPGPRLWSQRGTRRTSRQAEVAIDGDRASALRRVEHALDTLRARITWRDASGRVIALTPLTWTSWGDDLFVEVLPEDGRCRIRVTSQSILGTVVFDFGRNRRNVDRLRAAILASPAV